ncbi:MAG TPA: hypothetical protein PKI93_06105 [Alphaproteobacteria bacterium]|nr:hypothetical protein [Alphaproteobacteria bacterium]
MTLFVPKDQKDSTNDQTIETGNQQVESKIFMGTNPVLKNWKLTSSEGAANEAAEEFEAEPAAEETAQEKVEAPVYKSNRSYTGRKIKLGAPVASVWLQLGQALAVFLTVAWITYAAIYILALPGSVKAITSSPLTLGGVLASVLAPVAMLWLCIATWQRRSDAHIYAQALKEELRGMLFPDEEQSKLISEDIHMLMRQASEMSASSRAAIKAIQRARAGLRTEIRDFAGVSQKTEFHIDRLADTLGKRSEELLSLTETIEAQTTMISHKAGQGIQSWENVSAEISELGEEINALFTSGAEKISQAGDRAKEQVAAIENGLGAAAQDLSKRMDDIAAQIQRAQLQMETDTSRLEGVAASIDNGANRFDESLKGAERISSAVEGVISVMEGSLEKVETTSKSLFERTDHIEQKLSERAENLATSAKDLLDSTAELEKVGDLASHKLGEALTMALSGADTITASVRKSKELIDKAVAEASGQIENSGRAVEERIDRLVASSRTNRDEVSSLIETLEEKSSKLESATAHLAQQRRFTVEEIEGSSEILRKVAEQVVERAEEPVALMTKSVDRLAEQTKDLDDRLSVRIVELEQSRSKLGDSMTEMSSSLKSNLQDVAAVTGQLASHSKQIGDHVEYQKEGLSVLVDELERRTAEIAELLKAQTQDLTDSLTVSESQIGLMGQALFDRGDALLDHVSGVADNVLQMENRIIEAMETIDQRTS